MSPSPAPHAYHNAVAVEGAIYTVGDETRGAFERYDPAADRWKTLAAMPTPRVFAGASAIGSTIYVAGGYARATPIWLL